jgi:hypothetical protein
MGVAVGSSIQIALFVIPFMTILGWIMDKPLSLLFDPFESVVSAFDLRSRRIPLTNSLFVPDSLPVRPYRQLHHSGWPIKLAYVYFPVLCASSDERI